MSCTCQECGRKYKVDLIVPDNIWDMIRPYGKTGDAGLLCGPCIMNKIESLDQYDVFHIKGGTIHGMHRA